ncbi:helix-turn-helix domain-containing protein [Streptomyces noursei]|uniref:helix-turn-helix domain-containing protein n=1 Tax=Streptomyces noursei TaxID=1971 RepID=UPI0035DE2B18
MSDGQRLRRTPPSGFAPALAGARQRAALGVRATARAVGISPGYLSRLERGLRCPSRSVAEQLIVVLQVDGDERAVILGAAVDGVGRDHPARRPRATGSANA